METILIEKQDNFAIVTINRPTKLNALNKATIEELHTIAHKPKFFVYAEKSLLYFR